MSNLKRYKHIPLDESKILDAIEDEKETIMDEAEIQKKEKKIHKLITKCKKIAIEIEEQLDVVDENPSHWLRAKLWFDVKMKILRDNWWKLRSMDTDLTQVEHFLVTLSKESVIWKSIGETSKMSLSEWQEVANRATMKIIHLRRGTQHHPRKERNVFVKNLTTCFGSFYCTLDMRLLQYSP